MNTKMSLVPLIFLTYFPIFSAFAHDPTSNSHTTHTKLTQPPIKISNLTGPDAQISQSLTLITGNTTISSPNKTFKLGFFSTNDESKIYLGIWYASIPTPTYVWVANRESPVGNLASAFLVLSGAGKLEIIDSDLKPPENVVWRSDNVINGTKVKLLEQGNLVILSSRGDIVWNSFDFPADTWLPEMNLTAGKWLTSWKSSNDPAPGNYSLRLSQDYGEIVLSYNGDYVYWDTGKWSMNTFSGVPEMSIPYIYKFNFVSPWTPNASFGYTETALEGGKPPLTRFFLDYTGQLKQFTWSPQTANWNMFWSQPENICKVYGLCGNYGFCNARMLNPCKCLIGFRPVDGVSWDAGGFSSGCRRDSDEDCNVKDGFKEVGVVGFDGAKWESFEASRDECEKRCLNSCSCIGLNHNVKSNYCKNFFGSMLNIRNLTSSSTTDEVLHVRVPKEGVDRKRRKKSLVYVVAISGIVVMFMLLVVLLLITRKRVMKRRKEEKDTIYAVTNLKVFTYKELHAATKGFSEKLGHGGFGVVFLGQLSDSSLPVAVKRLERPGSGEKEFRAEVCTIGNIQHVNLVRLRGFCSEDTHRLLVYDYMPNGPLSGYLKKDGQHLSWDVRFRVAMGTARGIAYLHEECRNCIIHCDIKPENILLDEDFSAKVSDFGLAKLIGRDFSRVLVTMRGTWGYVAPEWISGVAITTKADVYSYGMTLLELIGGRRNVEGPPSFGKASGTGEKWFFPPWAAQHIIAGNVAAVVDERLGGVYNALEAERLGMVAIWCIQDEEEQRPTMGMVVKMLEGVVEVTIPPPPKLLQALVSGESFHGVGVDSGNRVSSTAGSPSDGDHVQLSGASRDAARSPKVSLD